MPIAKIHGKNRLVWLLLPLLISIFQTVQANEQVVLQLKWKHQFQFAGYYAAQTQGYFAEEGLDVEIREADPNRIPLDVVLSGDAQYGISDSSLVLARMQGKKPVILATIFQHSPLVLLTLKSSGIINPLELKSKSIMYLRNVDDAVLRAMFTEVGLMPNDYQHIPHTFNDDDLTTKKVDAISAYITDQPFYFRQNNIPVNIISPSNYGIDFYGDMIFTEENYLKENKQQALAFRRAAIKGWQYAISHPEEMVDWIHNNLAPHKTKANLLYEAKMTTRIIQANLIDLGYFSANRFHRIADIYKQLKLVNKNTHFNGINYLDYYKSESVKDKKWIKGAILTFLVLILIALFLWINNLRLKTNVQEKTHKLQTANRSMQRYLKVINHYVNACILSPDLEFIEASQALCKTLNQSSHQLIGTCFINLLDDSENLNYLSMIQALSDENEWAGEMHISDHSGQALWLDISIEKEEHSVEGKSNFTLIAIDISDQKRIEQLSLTDSLTGLANRRHFDTLLNNELKRIQRNNTQIALLMIDVDYFKQFNDLYGHLEGDLCLQKIANEIRCCAQRPQDLAVRYGGEEFALLLPEANREGATSIAQLLLEKIENLCIPHTNSAAADHVTISIGVAVLAPSHESMPSCIIHQADQQLYKAKSEGRNCISISHEEFNPKIVNGNKKP